MHPQTGLHFHQLRFVFAGIFAVGFLLLISALVTAIGSHSILDTRTNSSEVTVDTNLYDSSDVVTAGADRLMDGTKHITIATGTALYAGCRSITNATVQSGRSIVHGSAVILRGIGRGVAFGGRGVGRGIMFTLRAPGKAVAPLTSGHAVSAIIKPATDKSVPIISNQTSAAVLARFSAAQQQEIASLQAAQLTANRGLNGSIVAGDPNHGGYPANWDTAAQDSKLDSWGMYNRECVSYAAWKVYQTYGSMPYWGGVGNANQWVGDAKAAGIPTGPAPRVHSVAISMRGYYGHAMWVEAVSGNMIYVSQYNYDLHGHYSEMWVNSSSLTYIYFK